MLKIEYTDEIDYSRNCGTLVFGAKGVGKTVLCATAPNPIILDTEGGTLSLAEEHIARIRVHNVAEVKQAVKLARAKRFETIALDSLTKLAESELVIEKKRFSDIRHVYGAMQDTILELVESLVKLPVNVVVTCREDYIETKQGVRFMPNLPGRVLPGRIPHEFDYCLRLESFEPEGDEEYVSRLWCKPNPTTNTGDRSRKLNKTEPPDLTALFLKAVGKPKLKVVKEKSE